MLPHVTTTSSDCPFVFNMRACKCQLFTNEGSHRLPKRLNYCFSVLASANESIDKFTTMPLCGLQHHMLRLPVSNAGSAP